MLYAKKNADGTVSGIAEHQVDSQWLPSDWNDPAVTEYLNKNMNTDVHQQVMARMDSDFIRVLEDLIDAMIDRGMLKITDLPEPAQAKLLHRRHFRNTLMRVEADEDCLLNPDNDLI